MIEERVPDEDEFDEGPADPDAPPFPQGWTEVGATDEPIEVLLADLDGNGIWNDKSRNLLKSGSIGPAQIFTRPVESPIFEAIDRASEDRTPVLETKVPFDYSSFTDAITRAGQEVKGFSKTVESVNWTWEEIRKFYGSVPSVRHQIALMGTGYRRHVHPGPLSWVQRLAADGRRLSRAEHARARRLYSERLRRDRRRVRKGRAPILRSSAFQMLIPSAQIDVRKTGPEFGGMEIVLSPMVPEDQVFVVNNDLLKQHEFVEPKTFDFGEAERRAARYRDQATIYGYGMRPTGPFRTTNYFAQMMNSHKVKLPEWDGYTTDQFWVDETADWAPEHGSDVDRWINEGGADRG